MKKINSILLPDLKTAEDVKHWFEYLIGKFRLAMHPDDPFEDYISSVDGIPTFGPDMAAKLNEKMDQAFEICRDDIYDIGIEVTRRVLKMPEEIDTSEDPDCMDEISKPQSETKELYEVAMIAVIMGDHITEKLYEHLTDSGYITTIELIGTWAVEFYEKFKSVTEWCDEVYDNPAKWNLSDESCCWDDCVMEFADQKFTEFKSNH